MGEETPREVAVKVSAWKCRQIDNQIAALEKEKATIQAQFPELKGNGYLSPRYS